MTSVGVMASAVQIPAGIDVLMEPFNDFTTAPWIVTSSPLIVAGRSGTAGEINSISDRLDYNLAAGNQSDTITIGFAWRTPALQASHNIFGLRSDAGATEHNRLVTDSSGVLAVTRSTTTIAGPTASGMIAINTWYYLEVQIKLGDAPNGAATVRLNATPVITATGLDTKNAGTKTVYDQVRLSTPSNTTGGINQYDDLYLSVGGAPFKGDITIP